MKGVSWFTWHSPTVITEYWDRQAWANSVDADQMPYKAESVQDLLCLLLIQQFLYRSVGSQMDLLKPLGQVLQGVEVSQYLINTVPSV